MDRTPLATRIGSLEMKGTADGAPADATLVDVEHPAKATEFSIAMFNTIAIIDLERSTS